MKETFFDKNISPEIARKLIMLNTIIPFSIPDKVVDIASQNLFEDNYHQFLNDSYLRSLIFYNNFNKFLEKTLDFLSKTKGKPNIFVFNNILFFSNMILSVMDGRELPYKIFNNKSTISLDNSIDYYFIDYFSLKTIEEDVFLNRSVNAIFLELNGLFSTQIIALDHYKTFPHINVFGESYLANSTQHCRFVLERLFGDNNLIDFITDRKNNEWLKNNNFIVNNETIEYISGISKHLII